MFENPRRGRQARNFTQNVPKILDLKSSSENCIFRKFTLGAPEKRLSQTLLMQAPKGIRHKHARLHYRGVRIKASELISALAFPGRIVLPLIERCPYKVRLDSASFPALYVFYVREYARKSYAKVEIHPDSSLHTGVYT